MSPRRLGPSAGTNAKQRTDDVPVRAGPLLGIPALLREFGCPPEPIYESVGLDMSWLSDPDVLVSFRAASRLLSRCVAATGCEHFGLAVGERLDPWVLGITGLMLRFAPDVGTALRDLVRYLELQDRGGVVTLERSSRTAMLGYAIHATSVEAIAQIYDMSMALGCNILHSLCGPDWKPSAVFLPRRVPPDRVPYDRFFRAPIRFDADRAAIAFPARWLNRPITGAHALLHQHLQRQAEQWLREQPSSAVGHVHAALRRAAPSRGYSIAGVAAQLGMHPRTLNRRLRQEGTTFRRELDGIRYAAARQLLLDTSMSLSAIAAALGYAEASAFSRGFKRWSGAAPAKWRAEGTPENVAGASSGPEPLTQHTGGKTP